MFCFNGTLPPIDCCKNPNGGKWNRRRISRSILACHWFSNHQIFWISLHFAIFLSYVSHFKQCSVDRSKHTWNSSHSATDPWRQLWVSRPTGKPWKYRPNTVFTKILLDASLVFVLVKILRGPQGSSSLGYILCINSLPFKVGGTCNYDGCQSCD